MEPVPSHALAHLPPQDGAPRLARTVERLTGLLIPGETLQAYAVQRRMFALKHRRYLVVATSGRLIFVYRSLLGGFHMQDVRWQDLTNTTIAEGPLAATIAAHVTPGTVVLKAVTPAAGMVLALGGLRKEQAQQVYVICQAQEQAWREKNRVRELEEMRAKSGGLQLPPGAGGLDETGGAMARLQQARELLENGLISDAEFETIKAKVVAEL
jgi:hypothetical protein